MTAVRSLGVGGEGEVFELEEEGGGAQFALKWFHADRSTPERRAHIAELISRGAPAQNFLWPQGLIEDPSNGRFGYVMDLRPGEYSGIAALLRGDVPRSEPAVVRFAFELAKSFMALHTRGLCYRDINFGNAFIEPTTGEALICDNDNVGIDGVSRAMVMGSKKFMAPEIVRREAVPSVYTDRYSLAVMLFYLLIVHHPLEGALTDAVLADAESDSRHYGFDPVFCFDPGNSSNRPDPSIYPHVEKLWRTYPQAVRDLFTRSFTSGLMDPRQRVVDSEWGNVLGRLLSEYQTCTNCARPLYLDNGLLPGTCPNCGAASEPGLALKTSDYLVPMFAGRRVVSHALHGDNDASRVVGTVTTNPHSAEKVGLRNDLAVPVFYTSQDGTVRSLAPGRSGLLEDGVSFLVEGQPVEVIELRLIASEQ